MNFNCFNKLASYINFILFGLLFLISYLLISEYNFFKKQNDQLGELKEDYYNYITSLKKIINESYRLKESADSQETGEGEKKKYLKLNEEYSNDNFFLINRDYEYLVKNVSDYCDSSYKNEILRLYDTNTQKETTFISNLKNRKRRKLRRRSNAVVTYQAHTDQRIYESFKREKIFIWPIDRASFWLSSFYGPRKKINGELGFHTGIDLAAVKGTPVKAGADGVVIECCYQSGYGNNIVLSHNKKYKTRYAHLSKILVKVGQKVEQGQIIGKVGDTGFVRGNDGSHLHFEVLIFNKHANPFHFLIR